MYVFLFILFNFIYFSFFLPQKSLQNSPRFYYLKEMKREVSRDLLCPLFCSFYHPTHFVKSDYQLGLFSASSSPQKTSISYTSKHTQHIHNLTGPPDTNKGWLAIHARRWPSLSSPPPSPSLSLSLSSSLSEIPSLLGPECMFSIFFSCFHFPSFLSFLTFSLFLDPKYFSLFPLAFKAELLHRENFLSVLCSLTPQSLFFFLLFVVSPSHFLFFSFLF